jgi:hypothetical protein
MTKAGGHTLFCDDIRWEVGNKPSLMGIYASGIVSAAPFPITLPKLCFWIRYDEPINAEWESLRIHIYLPGQEDEAPLQFDYALKEARASDVRQSPLQIPSDAEVRRHIFIPFGVAPLVLAQEGWIKVRGHYEKEVVKMGVIPVTLAPDVKSS